MGIPGIPAAALTPIAGLIFFVLTVGLLLGFGILVPRWSVRQLLATERKRGDEANERAAVDREAAVVNSSIAQQLTEQGVTLTHILSAITPPGDPQ